MLRYAVAFPPAPNRCCEQCRKYKHETTPDHCQTADTAYCSLKMAVRVAVAILLRMSLSQPPRLKAHSPQRMRIPYTL